MASPIKISGPGLKRVMSHIQGSNLAMVDQAMHAAPAMMQKQAQELAPVKSGQFKNDIRIQQLGETQSGQIESQTGIMLGTKSFIYAAKVERKHKIFRNLETTQKTAVSNVFSKSINEFWKQSRNTRNV